MKILTYVSVSSTSTVTKLELEKFWSFVPFRWDMQVSNNRKVLMTKQLPNISKYSDGSTRWLIYISVYVK
jgi:hypothetical protein